MRTLLRKQAISILAACLAAVPALADDHTSRASHYSAARPVVGGLSLVPERWRYRAAPTPAVIADTRQTADTNTAAGARLLSNTSLRTLETAYVADRESFINTLRARRGLSLLTLWEGAGRCLFFGVTEDGRAGINFVRVRRADRKRQAPSTTQRLYAEMTGQPRATFPEAPSLFPH